MNYLICSLLNSCLSGSLSQPFYNFCESAGFFHIFIRINLCTLALLWGNEGQYFLIELFPGQIFHKHTGCIKKLFPFHFLSISQLLLRLGIIFFSFLKRPFNGLIKNVKKFDSRCKIRQEIQHFVQANTNLFNTNVHIRNLSNTEISELQKTDYISLWNYMFVYSWKNCNPNHPIWPRSPHWNYWNYFRNKWLTRRTQC